MPRPLAAALLLHAAAAAPMADMIKTLPGWDAPLPSHHFSGYLNYSTTKHTHYCASLPTPHFAQSQTIDFVECEGSDPSTVPTVLWMNGGPGCSSLDGLMYEHGPFRINSTDPTELYRFDYTWAKVANMLYIEAPIGVGFSYSDDPEEYAACNDDNTAEDNMHAVEQFFKLFPEYSKNSFYITGESYAGVYVPTLAEAITQATLNGTYTGAPLKGMAVGNGTLIATQSLSPGCSGTEIGVCGGQGDEFRTEYLLGTAFLPKSLKQKVKAACDWTAKQPSKDCEMAMLKMHETVGHIDLYNVYGPCISGSRPDGVETVSPPNQAAALAAHVRGRSRSSASGPDACIDSITASEYFNRAEVMSAIHVRKPSQRWAVCGAEPGWNYQSTRPNLPRDTYPFLVKNIKVTIYNGDWDSCVPYTDAEAWTEGMGFEVADPWHPWMYDLNFEGETSSQVGGYATRYKNNNFTFITVRGGRHEVPETAPDKAFAMIKRVISGQTF